MAFKKHNRQYDIVVFGATGYTGQLTAEYIAEKLPTNLKWAIAGRSEAKLRAVAAECKTINPDRPPPTIEIADSGDEAQVKALAEKAFVFLSVVGPYWQFGESAFKACAETGTHYLDVTGESVWVHRMIKKYESTAKASGAIMIPQNGIESAPPDLCTWLLASTIRKQLAAQTKDVVISIHNIKGQPSGGTLATAMTLFDHFSISDAKACYAPFGLSPVPHTVKPDRPRVSIMQAIFGSYHVPELGLLSTSIAHLTDATQVERTWGLLSTIPSRKEQFYGETFTWTEGFRVHNWLHGVVVHWGLLLGTILLVLPAPLKSLIRIFTTPQGQGVDKEKAAREQIEYRGIATAATESPVNQKAFVKAWYNGGIYYLTGLFLAQAAMTILEDDLDLDGGILTPACLGQGYIDRVDKAGFRMEARILDN